MFQTKKQTKAPVSTRTLVPAIQWEIFLIDVHATLVLSERGRKAKTIDEKQKLTHFGQPFQAVTSHSSVNYSENK